MDFSKYQPTQPTDGAGQSTGMDFSRYSKKTEPTKSENILQKAMKSIVPLAAGPLGGMATGALQENPILKAVGGAYNAVKEPVVDYMSTKGATASGPLVGGLHGLAEMTGNPEIPSLRPSFINPMIPVQKESYTPQGLAHDITGLGFDFAAGEGALGAAKGVAKGVGMAGDAFNGASKFIGTAGKSVQDKGLGRTVTDAWQVLRRGSKPVQTRIGDVARMGDETVTGISSKAKSEVEGLGAIGKRETDAIRLKGAQMEQQAADEAAQIAMRDGLTEAEQEITRQNLLKNLQDKSASLSGKKTGLEGQLEQTAKAEAAEVEKKAANYFKQKGKDWETRVDDISNRHGVAEIDASSTADDMENLLAEKRSLQLRANDDGMTEGATDAAEKAVLDISNRLRQKGTITLKEALDEVSTLSRKMKVGAGYSTNDHLFNEMKDIILSKAEGATGGLGEITKLRSDWAQFAQQRTAAIRKFGLRSKVGVYDPKGREFLQKNAVGNPIYEERQLVSDMEKNIGPIGRKSNELGGQIKNVESEIASIDEEISALSKNPLKSATKSSEYMETAKKRIADSIEKEISDLNMKISHESALIENNARTATAQAKQSTEKSLSRLRDLKRRVDLRQKQLAKAAAITTIGSLVVFRKKISGLAMAGLNAFAG